MAAEEEKLAGSPSSEVQFRYINTYRKDELVFEEGSRGREMYVIYTGQVRISRKDSKGSDTVLSILESGDIFGEMALIDQEPRSGTATAVENDTKLVVLDRARFMYLLRHEPEFALIVMEILCQRVREKNEQYASLFEKTVSS